MKNTNLTDHIGMITACVCIVHCVALPFLLLYTTFGDLAQWHSITLFITVLITGHALWHGWKDHCKHIVVFFGVLGITCLLGGVIAHEFAHGAEQIVQHGNHVHTIHVENTFAEILEVGITIIGSLLIITAHLFNLKYKKKLCCTNNTCG